MAPAQIEDYWLLRNQRYHVNNIQLYYIFVQTLCITDFTVLVQGPLMGGVRVARVSAIPRTRAKLVIV